MRQHTTDKNSTGQVRSLRSKDRVEIVATVNKAPWTRLADLGGNDRSGFKSVAILLERAQIHDRRACRAAEWSAYPDNRFGFIAYTVNQGVRFLGVGDAAEAPPLQKGERMFKIKLPFSGCGRDLAEAIGIYHLHSELMEQHGRNTGPVDRDIALKIA
jgi:hypothetical protein